MSDRNPNECSLRKRVCFHCVPGKSAVASGYGNSLIQDSLPLFPPLDSAWLILQTGFIHITVTAVAGASESHPLSRKGPFSFTVLVRKSMKDSNWLGSCPSLSQSLQPGEWRPVSPEYVPRELCFPQGKGASVSDDGGKRSRKTETTDLLRLGDWENVDKQRENLGGMVT